MRRLTNKLRQIRDKIKKEYCYLNNIPLIIISYLDKIDEVMNYFFE